MSLRVLSSLLLAATAASAPAQLPPPLPDPAVTFEQPGFVDQIATDAQGRILIVGSFHAASGRDFNALARLNPDGTADESFSSPFAHDDEPHAVAHDADGRLYVAGYFKSHGNAVVRLHSDGSIDPTWKASFSAKVRAIAIDEAARVVYVGGFFDRDSGPNVNGLARIPLDGDGAPDGWTPPAGHVSVNTLLLDGDKLYVGGGILIGASVALNAMRLNTSDGSLDAAWAPKPQTGIVKIVRSADDNYLYLAGRFNAIHGVARRGIARVDKITGALDTAWNPLQGYGTSGDQIEPSDLCEDGEGGVLLIGQEDGLDQLSPYFALRVNAVDGALDPTWTPDLLGHPWTCLAGAEGAMLVGGQLLSADGVIQESLVRLDQNGARDPHFVGRVTVHDADIQTIVHGDDGVVFVNGWFSRAGGQPRRGVAKLVDGVVDNDWNPRANGYVDAIALVADRSALAVGGRYSTIGGQPRTDLALVDLETGAALPGFAPELDGFVYALAVDGPRLIVGGGFTSPSAGLLAFDLTTGARNTSYPTPGAVYALAARDGVVFAGGRFSGRVKRIRADGTLDPVWSYAGTEYVQALALSDDGTQLYVGGIPSTGTTSATLSRVDAANGVRDAAWAPAITCVSDITCEIGDLADDGHGGLIVGGVFNRIGSVDRNGLARIDAAGTGALDIAWNPAPADRIRGAGVRHLPYSRALSMHPGGAVDVGGGFVTMGGTPRNGLARLPIATTTTIASHDPATLVHGQTVTVRANVVANFAEPDGVVVFDDGCGHHCTSTIVDGSASCTFAAVTGPQTFDADYEPADDAFDPSTDSTMFTAAQANTLLTVAAPASAVFGEVFTVTPALDVVAPGVGVPTGTLTVTVGGKNCVRTLPDLSPCEFTATTRGALSIAAEYPGDEDFVADTAEPATATVVQANTDLTITSSASTLLVGDAFTVTPALTVVAPGAGVPTGTIAVTAVGQSCMRTLPDLSPCAFTATTLGTSSITAQYSGDDDFAADAADPVPLAIVMPTADISLALNGSSDVIEGNDLRYILTLANAGPHAATGARLHTTIPPALINVRWQCSAAGAAACPADAGTGSLDVVIDLPAGGSLTYLIDVDAVPGNRDVVALGASIELPAGIIDPDEDDRDATDTSRSPHVFTGDFE